MKVASITKLNKERGVCSSLDAIVHAPRTKVAKSRGFTSLHRDTWYGQRTILAF